jgi:hypothetical protein
MRLQPWRQRGRSIGWCRTQRVGSAVLGADSEMRAVDGSVEKIASAAVAEGSSDVVHIGIDGPCSGGGGQWRWHLWHRRCYGQRMGRQSQWRRLYVERREKEITPSPSSLRNSALHRLFTAFLIRLAGCGDGIRNALKQGLWRWVLWRRVLGDEGSGGKGLDTRGSDSEGSHRGDVRFPVGFGGGQAQSRQAQSPLRGSPRSPRLCSDGSFGRLERRCWLMLLGDGRRA